MHLIPTKKRRIQPLPKKAKERKHEENCEMNLMGKALAVMNQRADDWDLFGQFVASELRQITDSLTRNSLKKEIMKIF